ncbi:unnamed protein product, partial [Nesidiocoris tenuis]
MDSHRPTRASSYVSSILSVDSRRPTRTSKDDLPILPRRSYSSFQGCLIHVCKDLSSILSVDSSRPTRVSKVIHVGKDLGSVFLMDPRRPTRASKAVLPILLRTSYPSFQGCPIH